MTATQVIEVSGLVKSLGGKRVLDGVDLTVPAGSCCTLLGPNGAGKTTTVRILATLMAPDAGRVRVAGWDVVRDRRRVRAAISVTGQHAALDGMQTGEENLRMLARLAGLGRKQARQRAAEVLEKFGLAGSARQRVATFSGGMRRRLDLAASLVVRPAVIFLDEPTTGLDLPGRLVLWQAVAELRRSGVTVFLTTQYLEEADQLADRIAVLHHGRVVADGSPAELKRRVAASRLELVLATDVGAAGLARAAGERALRFDPAARRVELATDGSAQQVRALLDEFDPNGRTVERFSVRGATLDDVFLALTGHAGQGPAQPALSFTGKDSSHA